MISKLGYNQFTICLILVISTLSASSQDDEYYNEDYLRFENHVYHENIQTVQLNIDGNIMSAPIINLYANEKLRLSFDDLGEDHINYNYTIIHCSANWEDSELFSTEYIQGVPEDVIYENSYSRSIGQTYVHHWLVFPSDNMKIIRSGNYLIKVYEEGDSENIAITWRFMITENRLEVNGRVFPTNDSKYRFYKQELNFTIGSESYLVTNPYDDLKVTILQNGRWDNAHYDVQPTFVKGDEIEYINQRDLIFNGGNEFRYFDIKNLTLRAGYVKKYYRDSLGFHHVILEDEEKRAHKVYSSYIDINGRRYIKNDYLSQDSNVDADYAWVYFTFPQPQRITDGDVYLFGELTNWETNQQNKMIYYEEEKAYKGKLYLKQGYYNYQYVFLKDNTTEADDILLEGMHSETENDYTILVYHRQMADDYDRLIAVKTLNSVRTLQLTMPIKFGIGN
ncbi:MAG: DUF5103 domain-containing protein [Flavobacteriales bacterium]|nr:DUF5103 domain-containing protein [Flavobacteriales bacterium]